MDRALDPPRPSPVAYHDSDFLFEELLEIGQAYEAQLNSTSTPSPPNVNVKSVTIPTTTTSTTTIIQKTEATAPEANAATDLIEPVKEISKRQRKKQLWRLKKAARKEEAAKASATKSNISVSTTNPFPTCTEAWEIFHTRHSQGKFFKPKRYLIEEFPELLTMDTKDTVLLDAGCGNGAAIIPFLRATKHLRATAFDCSPHAIELLRKTVTGTAEELRLNTEVCDMINTQLPLSTNSCGAGLLIFVLSSVPIEKMPVVLKEIHRVLRPNSLLCFRDYGIYDMSHLRSTKQQWLGGRTFYRGDEHTLVTFFDLKMLRTMFVQCGYIVDELKYACVQITNRKTKKSWRRCFVHAKIRTEPFIRTLEDTSKISSAVGGGVSDDVVHGGGGGCGGGGSANGILNKTKLGEDLFLSVRQSQIGEIAGDGLYVNRNFKKGEVICVYTGDVYNTHDAMRLKDKSYLMRLGAQKYVDAKNDLNILGRYINDCKHTLLYNVRFDKRPNDNCANVVATRDIHKNEELFVDYGWKYWLSIKGKRLSPTIAAKLLQDIEQRKSEKRKYENEE